VLRKSPCVFSWKVSSCVAGVSGLVSMVLTTPSFADTFRVTPTLSLEESVTDNVEFASAGKRPDGITSVIGQAIILGRTRRASLDLNSRISYDKYVSSGQFDAWHLNLGSRGEFALLPDHLSLSSRIDINDVTVDNTTFAPTLPASTKNQVRVSNYDFGGAFSSRFLNLADINLQGRYAEVQLAQRSDILQAITPTGVPIVLPPDSSILQGIGTIDTGTRSRRLQATASGEYLEENHGFLRYYGIYSLFTRLTPKTRIIGRAGYESTFDPGITNIEGIIWSGGIEYTAGLASTLRLEYGHRYDHASWDANMALAMSSKLFLIGSYSEALESEQVRLDRGLRTVLVAPTGFPVEVPVFPTVIDENLVGATRLSRDLDVGLVWDSEPRRLALTGTLNQRDFFTPANTERYLVINARYQESVTPQLGFTLSSGAERSLNTIAGQVQETTYRSELEVSYDANSKFRFTANYTWEKRYGPDGAGTPQNVVRLTVARGF